MAPPRVSPGGTEADTAQRSDPPLSPLRTEIPLTPPRTSPRNGLRSSEDIIESPHFKEAWELAFGSAPRLKKNCPSPARVLLPAGGGALPAASLSTRAVHPDEVDDGDADGSMGLSDAVEEPTATVVATDAGVSAAAEAAKAVVGTESAKPQPQPQPQPEPEPEPEPECGAGPEPEPEPLAFPPPPKTKTFNADALRKYRLTRAAYEATPSLGVLLAALRGEDKRQPKCYASLKGSQMELHVADLDEALAQLRAHEAGPDWDFWTVGKSEEEKRRAKRIALTPTAATLVRWEANGEVSHVDKVGMPAAVRSLHQLSVA
jgi:hypothetical protein